MASTASVYNHSRTARQILKRHRKDKPSLILHLHNSHFRFERQNGMFLFDSPVKAFLQFIRDQRVPADLMDVLTESGVEFFEGCLIVEVHDHRSHVASSNTTLSPYQLHSLSAGGPPGSALARFSQTSPFYLQEGGRYGAPSLLGSSSDPKPKHGVEIYRIVLHPTSETLWVDLKQLDAITGGIWTDTDALQVEAKILALTAPPLCLTPDPQATRISNLMLSATAPPSAYTPSSESPLPFHRNASRKRGANSIEMEKEELNRQRRDKIMRMMQSSKTNEVAFVPTFGRMQFLEKWRMSRQILQPQSGIAPTPAPCKDDPKPPVEEPKKLPPKKKKAQKEEAAAATDAKKEEAPKVGKKKKAQLEKERKEKEEKDKAAAAAKLKGKKKEETTPARGNGKTAKKTPVATTGAGKKPAGKKQASPVKAEVELAMSSVQTTPTQTQQQIPQQQAQQMSFGNYGMPPTAGFPMQLPGQQQQQQQMGLMLPGGGGGFPMMQPQQNGQQGTNDLPVGVGLVGLANWGNPQQ